MIEEKSLNHFKDLIAFFWTQRQACIFLFKKKNSNFITTQFLKKVYEPSGLFCLFLLKALIFWLTSGKADVLTLCKHHNLYLFESISTIPQSQVPVWVKWGFFPLSYMINNLVIVVQLKICHRLLSDSHWSFSFHKANCKS